MEEITKGLIIGIFLTIAVIGLITLVFNPFSTGQVTCKQYSCTQTTKEATYEILGKKEFSGGGNLFGSDAKFSITVKNNEDQGAKFKVFVSCETLKKPAAEIASEAWIQPRGIYEFKFTYPIGANEDWTCSFSRIEGGTLQDCLLVEV